MTPRRRRELCTRLAQCSIIATLLVVCPGWRSYSRDPNVTREFQMQHPCPSTGLTYGRCPGYIKDHIQPLCAGGADATWNMQWQTAEDSYRKDQQELELCRQMRYREKRFGVSQPTVWTNNPRTDR